MSKVILSDLFPLHSSVPLREGANVDIRPLKLTEIITLLMQHKEGLLALYNESQKDNPQYMAVISAVPDMITDIICMGAAELADQRSDVELLPPGPQVQLLASIWELSVPDPKKLIESLSKLMGQVQRLAHSAKTSPPEQASSPSDLPS